MSDTPEPKPLERPAVRLMVGDPEVQEQLRNYRPEQQPTPFQKREEEPARLEITRGRQPPPTLGMNGTTTYTNSRVPEQSPQQQQPEKQQPEPVPDILAEARRRITERGGEGRPMERALSGGLELSPEGIAGLERRR